MLPVPSHTTEDEINHATAVALQAISAEANDPVIDDPRLQIFRKLPKTLKPAVLLKSWQRICMLVAGIETVRDCGQASSTVLENEIYDRYHGNLTRDPPVIGTVKRAIDDQLDVLACDKFGIKFPKDKISYVQMTTGMPGHTIWRYYKELVSEVANKINLVYRGCLNDDLSFTEGKSLYDTLEETLRILWVQNEDVRKDRITKRTEDGVYIHDDSDSDREGGPEITFNLDSNDRLTASGRKRFSGAALMNTKPFPGVGKYQPIGFLSFLLLGPPAGEKCWNRFALDAHLEAPPRVPRVSMGGNNRLIEDHGFDDGATPRTDRKRPRKENEEENEAIRVFNAETAARAQRLEELKLALSLFPNDENIKAELKQFVDSQRRTSLATMPQDQLSQQPMGVMNLQSPMNPQMMMNPMGH